VPVDNVVLAPTTQARNPFDVLLAIPDVEVVGVQTDLDLLADPGDLVADGTTSRKEKDCACNLIDTTRAFIEEPLRPSSSPSASTRKTPALRNEGSVPVCL